MSKTAVLTASPCASIGSLRWQPSGETARPKRSVHGKTSMSVPVNGYVTYVPVNGIVIRSRAGDVLNLFCCLNDQWGTSPNAHVPRRAMY